MEDNRIDWRALGNRIAEMRLSRGITQFQLAEKTGHSRVYIGYIEEGKRSAPLQTCLEIVTALGYSLDDLVRTDAPDPASVLMAELNLALDSCSGNEREQIVRIFREMLHMIRLLRGEDPDTV